MSYSKNFVLLIGGLGKEPESKYSPSGTQIVNLSLATSESYKKKGDTEWTEETEWHKITAFGATADIAAKYAKGDVIEVTGKIKTSSWDDENGVKKYSTSIIADRVKMVKRRNADNNEGQSQQATTQNPVSKDEEDLPF